MQFRKINKYDIPFLWGLLSFKGISCGEPSGKRKFHGLGGQIFVSLRVGVVLGLEILFDRQCSLFIVRVVGEMLVSKV